MKRLSAFVLLAALGFVTLVATPALAAAPTVAAVANSLKASPVYVDPATQAGGLTVDAARLTPVVPKGVHVAVLTAAVIPAGVDPTELPALISSRIGQGGTFVILINGTFYGASTEIPGQLADDLATAQAALPKSGDATPALIALARSLDGPGDAQDVVSPARAGGPIGLALLIVIAVVLVVGGLALWWWLRRKPPARKVRRPEPLRDLVEIDYEGQVVRRTPAAEREQ